MKKVKNTETCDIVEVFNNQTQINDSYEKAFQESARTFESQRNGDLNLNQTQKNSLCLAVYDEETFYKRSNYDFQSFKDLLEFIKVEEVKYEFLSLVLVENIADNYKRVFMESNDEMSFTRRQILLMGDRNNHSIVQEVDLI